MFPNYLATPEDSVLISQIIARALESFAPFSHYAAGMRLEFILTACHVNGCPLDLHKLLESDDESFWHDLDGINTHLHKQTGALGDYFVPRAAIRQ